MHPGLRIGPYEITDAIGAGGMGEVFRARDTRLNRDVAIKALAKDFVSDAERLRRFEQETKTLAALNHPNVLTIHDAGIHEGAPYLVSELLEGKSLREVLGGTTNAPLPVRKAIDYALQIAHGLAAAHSKGVIHRDLKPENIFVTKDGRVKILDFGLAKLRDPSPGLQPPSPHSTGREQGERPTVDLDAPTVMQPDGDSTQPGKIMGTPAYMSPEQVRGEPADHRSDIFAFGCVLYEVVTGQRPFKRDTSIATMAAVMNDEPQDLTLTKPEVLPALVPIVHHCLEKQPDRRFQSASDLSFALETASGSGVGVRTLRPQAAHERRSFPKLLFSAAALFLGIGILLFTQSQRRPTGANAPLWRGERLDGPVVAFTPRPSPDGKELAICAMVDGLSQLAVMIVQSGDSKILTTNRSRGLVSSAVWSLDGSQIIYDRVAGGPNGVYRISKLGGEERLVLERASDPRALADGSILLYRRNADGNNQLCHFSPETERVRELNGLPAGGPISTVELLSSRTEAVFWGRRTNDLAGALGLWRIDLKSGLTKQFLTNVAETLAPGLPIPFACTADGRRFLFTQRAGNLWRISAVDLLTPGKPIPLLSLMDRPTSLEIDGAGSLYLDQAERPNEIIRHQPGGTVERFLLPPADGTRIVLPLPNNRFLLPTSKNGIGRLMIVEPGKELNRFIESKLDSGTPFARLGREQIVFTIRDGSQYELAIASLEGRAIKKVAGGSWGDKAVSWGDKADLAVAGTPDGQTIYYVQGGFVYSLPASGGTPTKICAGQSVAMDPHGEFLAILVRGAGENYLVRYSFANRTEQRITVSGKYPIAGDRYALGPGAVGPDGRIVVMVAPLDSWFWSAAIIDPRTGEMKLASDLQADMAGSGWDEEGRLVTSARFYRSSLWRFRLEN